MKRSLNSTEREELIKSHRKKRDKRICDRIKAVLLHDDGYSYSKIARILLIDSENGFADQNLGARAHGFGHKYAYEDLRTGEKHSKPSKNV